MKPPMALLLVATTLGACSAVRSVRPVGAGRYAGGASVGGPLFTNLGGAVPTPVVTAFGRYGLDERTDVDVGLSPPIVGAAGLDAGLSRLVLEERGRWRPAVMVGGRLSLWGSVFGLAGRRDVNGRAYAVDARLFEEVWAVASRRVGPTLVYAGLDLFAQAERGTVRPTPLAGVLWQSGERLALQLELKQMALLTDQRFAAVDFVGPVDRGALALNLGFQWLPRPEAH